jgi:hypothetical protein
MDIATPPACRTKPAGQNQPARWYLEHNMNIQAMAWSGLWKAESGVRHGKRVVSGPVCGADRIRARLPLRAFASLDPRAFLQFQQNRRRIMAASRLACSAPIQHACGTFVAGTTFIVHSDSTIVR